MGKINFLKLKEVFATYPYKIQTVSNGLVVVKLKRDLK